MANEAELLHSFITFVAADPDSPPDTEYSVTLTFKAGRWTVLYNEPGTFHYSVSGEGATLTEAIEATQCDS